MQGVIKTKKQAEDYAADILAMTGRTHLVFKVPPGSTAYGMGYRYATCEEGERDQYVADGAEFLEALAPTKEGTAIKAVVNAGRKADGLPPL